MFDFHIHTTVSYDGYGTPAEMLRKAEALGLKEICFTDHLDYFPGVLREEMTFSSQAYSESYDQLRSETVKIRRGCEFGMLPDNQEDFVRDMKRRPFDFVIGSVHGVDGVDIYYPDYWADKTVEQAERRYFEEVLACVNAHEGFDVLGHLTYITKLKQHPTQDPIAYGTYRELTDEILRVLVDKGIGLEVNTSGMDTCGAFLPDEEYLRRFKELGGEIVTVGSDAHGSDRIGQHCTRAVQMVQNIFGYVCTFENRQPIFHKI